VPAQRRRRTRPRSPCRVGLDQEFTQRSRDTHPAFFRLFNRHYGPGSSPGVRTLPLLRRGQFPGQNSNVIYPGQRPGRVLRFPPPEAEKAWSEARPAHSAGAYTAAELMCLPAHKGWKDRKAVRPAAAARRGQKYLLSASRSL
jgi:hypothetical protein